MQDRRNFLKTAAAGLAGTALGNGQQLRERPNFVVILADDMGFSDAGCYGGQIDTPNLDRLASGGLRYTQMYSTARCGPSRSCLLTGRYAQQTASDVMTAGNVPDYTRFLPEYLKPLGYRSYHSGKWHMRFATGEGGVGFDRSYTLMDEDRYFSPRSLLLNGNRMPMPRPEDGYYTTTAIADYGVEFLQEHAARTRRDPFFLFTAFHAPHFPLHALAEDIARYKDRFAEGWDVARERKLRRMRQMGLVNCGLAPLEPEMWTDWNTPDVELISKIGPGEISRAVPWAQLTAPQRDFQRTKMALHAAMITRMDLEVGKVLRQLDAMKATRNTVILFLSDNGASSEQLIRGDGHDSSAAPGSWRSFLGLGPGWSSCSNAPFRLHKSWLHEGGIASPMIVHWPDGIKDRNRLRHNPGHFVDVLPTMVDLAGGKIESAAAGDPGIAGRSLTPSFAKDMTAAHDFIYFNHNNNRALRIGNWKALATGNQGKWELYDLSKDRSEQRNLASSRPEILANMASQWKQVDDDYARQRQAAPPSAKQRMRAG